MKRLFINVMIAVILILLTVVVTYRTVIHNISIEVSGDTAYLTAFGMTDEYEIGR